MLQQLQTDAPNLLKLIGQKVACDVTGKLKKV